MNENERLAKELAQLRLKKENREEMLALQRKREKMKREIWLLNHEKAVKFYEGTRSIAKRAKQVYLEEQKRMREQAEKARKNPQRSTNPYNPMGNMMNFGW